MHNKIFTQRILISLSWLRAAALVMQVLYLLMFVSPVNLFVWTLLIVQVCLLLSSWMAQKHKHSETAVLLHLLFDVLLLGGYVYLTGGPTNPLIYLLLLPLVTAAVALRQRLALSVLLLACLTYTGLYIIEPTQHHHSSNFSSHLLGMWLVFMASGGLLFYVASYLSRAIRQQQIRIQHHERRQLRNDYLTALGISAADAAHQLNTPLSTLSILVEDLKPSSEQGKLMQQQIERCQKITQSIQAQFDELKKNQYKLILAQDLMQQLESSFRLMQPDVELEVKASSQEGWIKSHIGLESALLNLLDNAVKASLQKGCAKVFCDYRVVGQSFVITIGDFGGGIPEEFIEHYGWRPSPENRRANSERMGVGTLISNASIEIAGGQLSIKNSETGTLVTVMLPLVKPHKEEGEAYVKR